MNEQRFYVCDICGNIIAKIEDSGVPVICCGEPMSNLTPTAKNPNGLDETKIILMQMKRQMYMSILDQMVFVKERYNMKIVAISGSLRKDSFNTKILEEIGKLISDNAEYEMLDISEIPLFNQDTEVNNRPKIVDRLLKKIDEADFVIISTPEYNYSISGVLKNALDWFSRGEIPAFVEKKVAVISASISRFGGVRAQAHLKEVLLAMEADILVRPEIFVASAHELFKESILSDERTLKQLKKLTQTILEEN